ncbi:MULTISPECIES: zinc ribbon domain-containing protein [unclassified Nocardioides]|uniref:zinc ribbon domain-containing protein n=1 Tax=unclassified Nocardioides TaxID=2615069 RepID=UPI000703863B|nr:MULTISPECIES: zinc ribbon domain-containing protein [unclassified Nocardioides]KQP63328.1 hypothetical protein ASF47_14550 [Nocardioides sp. Leaf285]KQQ39728.1 hypothetical protein ASF50_17870 [Nocardioides sp. Leaf307]
MTPHDPSARSAPATGRRTPAQAAALVAGVLLLLGGLVALVVGFTGSVGSQSEPFPAPGADDGPGSDLLLFAGGGLAMVVGLGVVAFARAAAFRSAGGWSRVVVEQGFGSSPPRTSAPPETVRTRTCARCGALNDEEARFCDRCGTGL